jgi:uncharacterized protein
MTTTEQLRHAILATCVKKAKKAPGRTALMKYAYLLQTVRRVPLGYRFRLYNYGPYDDDLLTDLRMATNSGTLESTLVTYGNGYGYEFKPGSSFEEKADEIARAANAYEKDLNWIIEKFGDESAARLELISTIFFALCDKTKRREKKELVKVVHEIKPHFTEQTVTDAVDEMSEMLDCIDCSSAY